jgi:hypothetical protein
VGGRRGGACVGAAGVLCPEIVKQRWLLNRDYVKVLSEI